MCARAMAIIPSLLRRINNLEENARADDMRNMLTKMNQMKREMEAKEDQDAIFDSLDSFMDTIKRDSNVLVAVTHLQDLVKNMIREKENNVEFMNLAN
nr:hypothetical protein [Tanacetum cinerariifolium]